MNKEKPENENFYMRDHIKAFDNAKSKGLDKPSDYMYMYSRHFYLKDSRDYFKSINFRNYINFKQ